jgi:hypothetical protein
MSLARISAAVDDLGARVKNLEAKVVRTGRGRVNQRRAADYLGRSREFLRLLHKEGKGPPRGADGTYSLDDLDAFAEGTRRS